VLGAILAPDFSLFKGRKMDQVIVGRFLCPGVQIAWITDGRIDTVVKHYEEGDITKSSIFETILQEEAEKKFVEWTNEFLKGYKNGN
jgi:predicted type IV restriction endonuclease